MAALTLVVGCNQPADGTANREPSTAAKQFDPCSIPDDAIAAAGLDPATRSAGAGNGLTTPGWQICSWDGPSGDAWYYYSISFSMNHDLEEIRLQPGNVDHSEIEFAGRVGLQYRMDLRERLSVCNIAFDTQAGVAAVMASSFRASQTKGDLCEIVRQHTEQLHGVFPAS
ncbi:DUF3558 domain-containing protein [Rhodococcoides kyotonense]|nr:DUF3558 domain-containing protein [Rhodococcus kyotonensis]